ncbi:MAG TPA: thioesterase family protein [Kofleriaceae bacterium]|nr:thioesterase family protein [Kofleriaceae bacterium]
MPSEFDDDTALTAEAPGRYRGAISDRWSVLSGVPNGGLVMCYALRGLALALPQPDPLSLTAHFLRPARVGSVTVDVEVIKVGKRNATAVARLIQDEAEILRAIGLFGRLDDGARALIAGEPPPLPAREQCVAGRGAPGLPRIAERFDNRFDPATVGWMAGRPSGDMVIRAWMRLADGREPDALAMPLFADGLPPPLFNQVTPGWVPTLELTVHFRARPAPGWLRAQFRTRFVSGGLLDEDGELWDDAGQLVALSRQLAALPR